MARVVRLHTNHGFVCAVLGESGRKWTQYVSIDSFPVRMRKLSNREVEKNTKPLMKGKKPYPLKRACNQMLRVGRAQGMTKGARKLLLQAKAS